VTLANILQTGAALAQQGNPIATSNNLYLQILAALAGAGGLIPILVKVVPAIVKWREAREERKRQILLEPLTQLRADYEQRLLEACDRERQLRAERDDWRDQYRQAVRDWQADTEKFLVAMRLMKSASSKPPPPSR
jgi:hypothetical protein